MKPTSSTNAFESRVKSGLEQSLDDIPASTADAIRERRHQALRQAKQENPTSSRHPTLLTMQSIQVHFLSIFSAWPRAAMASAICLVLVLSLLHRTADPSNVTIDPTATIAMMDSLQSEEDLDVLTDPEFFWFASVIEDDNA